MGLNITYVVTEKFNFHHAKDDLFIQRLTHLWRNIIEWETWFSLPDNIFSILFQMRLLFAIWPLAPESLDEMCPCRELLVSWCTNTSRLSDFCMTPQISKAYSINLTGWDIVWGVTTSLNTSYFRFIYDLCRH